MLGEAKVPSGGNEENDILEIVPTDRAAAPRNMTWFPIFPRKGFENRSGGEGTGSMGFDQELAGEIFDFDLFGDQENVHNRPDPEQSEGEEPDQAREPSSQIESVKSEKAESAQEP